jgi:hypothetical protein
MTTRNNTFFFGIIAAIMLLFVVGCSKSPEQRLIGKWKLDAEKTLEQMPEEEREMAGAFIGMMNIELEFTSDTATMSMSMMGETETESGSYEVLSSSGDTLTIRLTDADDPEDTTELTITFDGNNTVRVSEAGDEMTMVLTRL